MKITRFARACAALAAAAACIFTASAFAAEGSQVRYEGGAESFIFAPESTDLFQGFKGVMPGDRLVENIMVVNDASKEVKVNLYIRAQAVDEQYKDFLNQFTISVKQGDDILFLASAGEQGGLGKDVLLGTFYSGAQTQIEVTLHAPITMADEYQNGYGEIEWVFTAQETPVSPDDPAPPSSGGANYTAYAFLGMAGALAVCAFMIGRLRRRRNSQ